MAEVVILGAGLTGLSAAYHLERQGFYDYKLFEKDTTVGGLCRSVQQDGFTFDYTGHLLHINDPYFKDFIQTIAGIEHFNTIHRRSYVYSHETYTDYPYQVNLYGLPTSVIAECIEGFVARKKNRAQNPTFEQWVLSNFGAGFAKHFFFPYQEKIFAYPVEKLSASWTGRFVPQTSLKEMISGALAPKIDTQQIGYNAQFFYPKTGGIEYWIKKLHEQLQLPVYTDYTAVEINTIAKVVRFANGHEEPYKQLITTLPLDFLLSHLQEKTHTSLFKASQQLRCNSVINFNLGINRPDLSEKHWIYFPEKIYPFYRLGFPHNFAESMAPAGCSSLYGEFSHIGQSLEMTHSVLNAARTATKKLFKLQDHEIVTEKIITIPHAYVIYDHWRDTNIDKLHAQLNHYAIYSVGRYGAWKYASMQEGVLDGKIIAETVLQNSIPHKVSPHLPEASV